MIFSYIYILYGFPTGYSEWVIAYKLTTSSLLLIKTLALGIDLYPLSTPLHAFLSIYIFILWEMINIFGQKQVSKNGLIFISWRYQENDETLNEEYSDIFVQTKKLGNFS